MTDFLFNYQLTSSRDSIFLDFYFPLSDSICASSQDQEPVVCKKEIIYQHMYIFYLLKKNYVMFFLVLLS